MLCRGDCFCIIEDRYSFDFSLGERTSFPFGIARKSCYGHSFCIIEYRYSFDLSLDKRTSFSFGIWHLASFLLTYIHIRLKLETRPWKSVSGYEYYFSTGKKNYIAETQGHYDYCYIFRAIPIVTGFHI